MKVIIAGSRTITDKKLVFTAVRESGFDITEIISGGAKGVDKLGELYAIENNIKLTVMKPDWSLYGKQAGLVRSREMARVAEAVIAVWDGKSRGTKHMIDTAVGLGLKVFIKEI